MKKYISVFILIGLLFTSCDDVLEVKQLNEWEDQYVWKIPDIAEGVLMKAYANIPVRPDNFDNNFLDVATDNALTSSFNAGVYKVSQGGVTSFNNPLDNWEKCYEQFQYIHQFMENGLTDTILYNRVDSVIDAQYKKRLLGEAYFLRAWWGFQLLQVYGGKTDTGESLGYPIVTRFITKEEAAQPQNFRRNTYEECVRQIVADCDSAIEKLPQQYATTDPVVGKQELGRATSVAAAILKVKTLLYGASPAYQPDNIVKINSMGDFTIADAAAYEKKWERVALYADTIIRNEDSRLGNFGTFYAIKAADLANYVGDPLNAPAELVFRKFFTNNEMENQHFPPYYWGNANTIPSQNLVDAFPMSNGYPVTDLANSGYDPQNPYIGRDKRFELNIYYQNKTFAVSDGIIDVVYGGKDSQSFHASATRSGYYLSKFMGKTNKMLESLPKLTSSHFNPLLRRAEVFMAFAEASNEAWGPHGKGPNCQYSAYDVVKMVREQSGGITDTGYLDLMAANKDDFRTLIQNEKRIEFAFENHRFFDMRRCLLPLNEPIRGMKVTRNTDSSLAYEVIEIEQRNMNDIRNYYSPIPYKERLKNSDLVNNLGWNN